MKHIQRKAAKAPPFASLGKHAQGRKDNNNLDYSFHYLHLHYNII